MRPASLALESAPSACEPVAPGSKLHVVNSCSLLSSLYSVEVWTAVQKTALSWPMVSLSPPYSLWSAAVPACPSVPCRSAPQQLFATALVLRLSYAFNRSACSLQLSDRARLWTTANDKTSEEQSLSTPAAARWPRLSRGLKQIRTKKFHHETTARIVRSNAL